MAAKRRRTRKDAGEKRPRGRPPGANDGRSVLAPGVEDRLETVAALAYALGLSDRRIQQFATTGVVVREGTGSYWLLRSVRNYVRFIRNDGEAGERAPESAEASISKSRARKMLADAERAELELLELAGMLVRTEDVERAWSAMLGALRSRILAIPGRLAPMVQDETDLPVLESILRAGIEDALSELASVELPGEILDDLPDDGPPSASAADGFAMGGDGEAA